MGASMTIVAPNDAPKQPEARLVISSIAVDAVIKEMGYTPTGAMAVLGNRIDVGWFEPGTVPGKTGSAVVGGHNRWDEGRLFDATDPDSGIFESLSGEHLNLITCSGVWDATTQTYTTRPVVFTDAV